MLCSVKVLNGIENWRNVSYKIEWSAEGKSLSKEEICGGLPNGTENAKPCPDAPGEVVSRLPATKYKIGQWVRSQLIIQGILKKKLVSFFPPSEGSQ